MSSPCKVKHVSFHQHCKTIPDDPSWRLLSQFTKVFYCNPGCETQCEDLPPSSKYPRKVIQEWCSVHWTNCALIRARENVFFWYLLMSLMHVCFHPQLSVPPEVCVVWITATTPLKILSVRKVTMTNIRIHLGCWYMACNRVPMITCIMFWSS